LIPSARLYDWVRPLLFALDPERAHDIALRQLDLAHRLGLTRRLAPALPDDPVEIMGLRFPNPVGLAAGLDKNAAHLAALASLGFGFIEAGTVTPRPQPGNPRPRMFRLARSQALINRLGFNNRGLDAFVAHVARFGSLHVPAVLGLNIGKNATTPNDEALADYRAGLRAVYPHAGYVTVNISSPNTRDLRALQGDEALAGLLGGLMDERRRLADRHGRQVPIAVKIAPDLADDELRRVADALVALGADAVIATNTTIDREQVAGEPHAAQAGGLSGAPLRERSTAVVGLLHMHLQGRLPIIGVGGILNGADAVAKLRAGASLVQLYTGLVYRGPSLVAECRAAILASRAPRNSAPA
jgi:dihydroorotate dehydrogenase